MTAVVIHYAPKQKNGPEPDDKWRDCHGEAIVQARGKGPRNVLVKTEHGLVVVPRWNVRWNG